METIGFILLTMIGLLLLIFAVWLFFKGKKLSDEGKAGSSVAYWLLMLVLLFVGAFCVFGVLDALL